jgi:acyl-coenzyme A thioesterase PaaI-like protein
MSDVEHRVRASFAKQQAMVTCGIELIRVEPGTVELQLRHSAAISVVEGRALADGKLIATMTATVMTIRDRPEVVG